MELLLVATGVVLALYSLHRIATWMAEKGWIYYGSHQTPAGAGSLAVMEMLEVFKPELHHAIEERVVGELRTVDDELGELDPPAG